VIKYSYLSPLVSPPQILEGNDWSLAKNLDNYSWFWSIVQLLLSFMKCNEGRSSIVLQHRGWILGHGNHHCKFILDSNASQISSDSSWQVHHQFCGVRNNNGALALASYPIFHARTNYVEINYDFLREKVANKDLLTQYIGMTDHVTWYRNDLCQYFFHIFSMPSHFNHKICRLM
jgi:hypothetical protein